MNKTVFRATVAGLLLLVAQCALAAEGTFNRTLTVSGASDVEITSGSGDITVRSGDNSKVIITGHVKSSNNWGLFSSGGDPQEKVDRIVKNPPIEQSGSWIRIGKIQDESLRNGVSISYDVVVPKETRLRTTTGSGEVRIDDIAGATNARSGSGSLRLHNIGADLDANTGSGEIEATGVSGIARAQTGSGDVQIELTGSGAVRAHTGSGEVTIRGAKGPLDASTGSGDVRAEGSVASSWSIHTGSGEVRIVVPHDAKFTLQARSSSGSVHSDLPISVNGSMERHALRGTVNGGGPTLDVSTGSGSISIQ
ncbi:MAG: DUF4097 family beta strand repeat-containing protein [Acidobacteriaceae bacterium]